MRSCSSSESASSACKFSASAAASSAAFASCWRILGVHTKPGPAVQPASCWLLAVMPVKSFEFTLRPLSAPFQMRLKSLMRN
eukprot:12880780-Prorocentrum_lima.AAC.1